VGGTRGCPARRRPFQQVPFQSSSIHDRLSPVLLAPRHLIFTRVEGTLVDPRTGSFDAAQEALAELSRQGIPLVLLTSRTRAEIEPLRRKLEHNHPFITESGGGIFFPDGYFHLRIPEARRSGRYFCVALGRSYPEVSVALDEIAGECRVGVTGFHHMSSREVAQNLGLRPRDSELARTREFDEPFFFTSADDQGTARFVTEARRRGCTARRGNVFWHLSCGSDEAQAVRMLIKLFRMATRARLRTVGVSATTEDCSWLSAVHSAVLLSLPSGIPEHPSANRFARKVENNTPGPAGWNELILHIIS
jgi:mannosyl-3-phosphoglycerate phosphatase